MLFYAGEYREQKIVEPKSRVDMVLRIATPGPDGIIERAMSKTPEVIRLSVDVPNFLPGALLSGDMARLRIATGASVAP